MGKSLGQIRGCGQVDAGLANSGLVEAGQVTVRPNSAAAADAGEPAAFAGWRLGMIADVDPALDLADRELRRRESRWPLVPSIALIMVLSAGLWLGIFALVAHLTARA